MVKAIDQPVQLTKSIKSVSPRLFHNNEFFHLKLWDILAVGCRL